jgi:carboxymethylenebutenolidase
VPEPDLANSTIYERPAGRFPYRPPTPVAFRDGKVESEHIYWDQASVLAQIGVLPSSGLPVVAAGQAKALLDPAVSLNTLLTPTG